MDIRVTAGGVATFLGMISSARPELNAESHTINALRERRRNSLNPSVVVWLQSGFSDPVWIALAWREVYYAWLEPSTYAKIAQRPVGVAF
jgi:hypothetical protein